MDIHKSKASLGTIFNNYTNMKHSEISFRPFCLSDLDDYFVLASDDLVSQFCGWSTFVSKEKAEAELRNYIIPDPGYKAITVRDKAVGYVIISRGSDGNRCRAEIGYTLASQYWGQGLATQAVKMVISRIFYESEDLERVEAVIDVDNIRSQRVVEKAGFVREGVLRKYWICKGRARDMVIYSFLRPDVLEEDKNEDSSIQFLVGEQRERVVQEEVVRLKKDPVVEEATEAAKETDEWRKEVED